MAELLNCYSRSTRRRAVAVFVLNLSRVAGVAIEPVSPALLDAGIGLYLRMDDKQWSLVDCVSFEIMRRQRIRRALTTDVHFAQAGFTALLA